MMLLLSAGLLAGVACAEDLPVRVIDQFEDVSGWKKIEAPGTKIEISQTEGFKGQGMCLDYDLGVKESFVVAVKEITPEHPSKGRFSFYLKTGDQDTHLEFKLVDQDGNTFMRKWSEPATRNKWQKISIKSGDITFAWASDGNTKSKVEMGEVKQVELGITGMGKGQVCIDQLILEGVGAVGGIKE
jgi:hypothetical protein